MMIYNEQQLIARINQLTMTVFLQEIRARVLQQQVIEANAAIVKGADVIKDLTTALLGNFDAIETKVV